MAVITVVFLFYSSINLAYAITKPGSTCSKLGLTSTVSGKKYTCIKSGKKLIWDQGVIVKPKKALTLPTLSPESTFISPEKCELSTKTNHVPPFDLSYNRSSIWADSVGIMNIAVLFLSYQDSQLNPKAIQEYESVQEKKAEEFFRASSYGKLTLNFVNSKNIFSIPKSTSVYNLSSPSPDNKTLFEDAMQIASSEFDFTKFDEVVLVMPDDVKARDLGPAYNFEAKLGNATIKLGVQGAYINPSNSKKVHEGYLTHELGHTLGLTHPYDINHDPAVWDIMQYDDTTAPDLFTWEKFILKWITPSQVSCLDKSSFQNVTIFLEANGINSTNKKMLIIPLSNSQALIVESKRKSAIDNLTTNQEGVIVYKLDLDKGFGEGAISLISNSEQFINNNGQPQWLDTLQQGTSLVTNGLRISIINHAATGDYVSIEKIS